MKVSFNTFQINKNKITDTTSGNKSNINHSANHKNISYPKNYYLQTFKGIPLKKLYEEYNWYINVDKIPAVNSFLKIDASKEVLNEFLTEILRTKDRGYEFIESIVQQPRNSDVIQTQLTEKLGNSQLLLTFMPNSPYNNAYINYIETKYQKANTLSELLKVRPDWSGQALLNKYISLTGKESLEIGNIPKNVPKEHMKMIINYLKKEMQFGIKTKKKIDNLVIDGRTYEFKFFTEGKSSKNVFGFFIPALGKKYVIKIESPERRSLDAPFALGTLAKIDQYLTTNRSRNSAPLCYYNHENNYSIYKYIEHTPVEENPNDINIIRKNLPDFKALGLNYNDTVGFKNFFLLNEHSYDSQFSAEGYKEALDKMEWISVDNDHVTYSSRFNPFLTKYHAPLPNAMQMFY